MTNVSIASVNYVILKIRLSSVKECTEWHRRRFRTGSVGIDMEQLKECHEYMDDSAWGALENE